jgi:hypothetical protein
MTFDRVMIAGLALAGRFDGLDERLREIAVLKEHLREAERVEQTLRKVIDKTQMERDYWYKLWFRMGTEFQAGQAALIEELDSIRRKVGVADADKLKELAKLSMQESVNTFVAPKSHPTPAVDSPLASIACPPERFEKP